MRRVPQLWIALLLVVVATASISLEAQESRDTNHSSRGHVHFEELRRFNAPEAVQGVAVDASAFYAIGNREIAKYDKTSGMIVKRWSATSERPLIHLNAGVVHEGRLYCAHSNFPDYPEASSVEIWNTDTLEHVDSHSLGLCEGSLTWIDRRAGQWWALFAHYSERVNENPWAKGTRWTSIVVFDDSWRRVGGWALPEEVLKRMEPHSASGGGWGVGDSLYVSGHDRGEVYELRAPHAGATLAYVRTLPAPITGQAFAWDPMHHQVLYGIDRARRQVVVMRLSSEADVTTAAP